jgi:hypothetical protein
MFDYYRIYKLMKEKNDFIRDNREHRNTHEYQEHVRKLDDVILEAARQESIVME